MNKLDASINKNICVPLRWRTPFIAFSGLGSLNFGI
jgi:hypothetical protein